MKKGIWLFALGAASPLAYVFIGYALGVVGFPLDDAWIHQVYARNLGWFGQWAFTLGQPSAGSTSPLWTLLLALGYLIHIDYYIWTIVLNSLLLGVLTWLVGRMSRSPYIALLIPLEWHLAWASASGMETIVFCVLLVVAWYLADQGSPLWCGVVIGLAVWTRPEGITLLPFCVWRLWETAGGGRRGGERAGRLIVGAALFVFPYLLFNVILSGQPFPNTFFAKQTEYAVLTQLPLWQRMLTIFSAPLVGVLVLLLPGIFLSKRWSVLIWVGVFLLSYVLRLPVTYQHGRYLIPVIPLLILVSNDGLQWVQLKAEQLWWRLLSRAWVASVAAVALVFWAVGLNAWVADVRLINSEMVQVAHWVKTNVPSGALVAAHDIGALGYFADVRLLDLAGLVSPEVIPLMHDEAQVWGFIRERQAQYVITYPGWCPGFTREASLQPVFQTGALCDPANPNLHMTVYQRR